LNQKIALVDKFKDEFSVLLCCRTLGLYRSTYYARRKKVSLTDKYYYLKSYLAKVIEDNSAYGYRRIKDALKNEHGQLINHKPLRKLLHDWNLALKRNIRKRKPSGIEAILKEMGPQANILMTLEDNEIEPLRLFQTDFTAIYAECGKIYLMPYLDYKTKIVAAYHISLNPDAEMAITAYKNLKQFLKQRDIPTSEVILHQDRGSPYTSYDYVSALVSDDITPSYSRVGKPGDNPGMESFFGRLKDERKAVFASARNIPELIALVEDAIRYYNYYRIHSKTNGRSPINNLPTILSE
jgi:transposase InsO family protein